MSLDIQNTLANVDESEYLTEQGFIGRVRDFVEKQRYIIDANAQLFDRKIEWNDLDFVKESAFQFDKEQNIISEPLLNLMTAKYPCFAGSCLRLPYEGFLLQSLSVLPALEMPQELFDTLLEHFQDVYGFFYKDVFFSIGTLKTDEPIVCSLHIIVGNELYTFPLTEHINRTILLVKHLSKTLWQVLQYKDKIVMTRKDRRKVIEDAIKLPEVA